MMKNINNGHLALLFVLLLCTLSCSVKIPVIQEDRVQFCNKKLLSYINYEKRLSNDQDYFEGPISIREEVKVNNKWKRVLVIREIRYYEGGTRTVDYYDYNGELLNITDKYSSDSEYKILQNYDYLVVFQFNKIYFINTNGIIDKVIEADGVETNHGMSDDEKIYWISIYKSRNVKEINNENIEYDKYIPINYTTFYNKDGVIIETKESEQEYTANIVYEDNVYNLKIPKPDFPG